MVSEPYGGKLVNRVMSEKKRERVLQEAKEMLGIEADLAILLDAEKIATGAYSPLEGFMEFESYSEVLYKNRLPNGLPWTIPIIFTPRNPEAILNVKDGEEIILKDSWQRPVAVLHFREKFAINKSDLAKKVYGTIDPLHPNIKELQNNGSIALAGEVELIEKIRTPFVDVEPSPAEMRKIFRQKGWRTIAGYQCRNPPHLAHEYIQRCAMEFVDGLLIHPVVGKLKKGDYKPEVIIQAYEALVRNYYPERRALLFPLTIAMRYAGPKAAIFLAIIRKNYGCTHFIVGRDIAGVGNYYDPFAAHRIFDELDIGIKLLKFEETFYCERCSWAASNKTCRHGSKHRVDISQTKIRAMLRNGEKIPAWIMRPEVAEVLSGRNVLIDK
jgi:sulfate adenylyltransferase